jgi:hypothetical protein
MSDSHALRLVLCLLGSLALSQACAGSVDAAEPPEPWHVPGDYCSADDNARTWSAEDKQRTRDRLRLACEAVGGSDDYCAFWDAVTCREAWCGVASAVHVQGTDVDGEREFGLGPLGLSVKWHGDKWDGDDEDPAFCSPEVSFVIGHAIAWAAVERYGARNWVELQAIFGGGGRRVCFSERLPSVLWMFEHVPGLSWLTLFAPVDTTCEVLTLPRHAQAICSRLGQRDIECRSPLTVEDLGEKIPLEKRREWALARVAALP